MNYNISVKEFLQQAENIDLDDFYSKLYERIKKIDEKINCFITITKSEVSEKTGSIPGLPISVKDNICTKGVLTTAGSKILYNYVPPFDATAVSRIKQEGGIVIGKTTMDEFGFGTFSVNTEKVPKNPWDLQRSCGGSSGGSGAITAALDFPHISLAESTGGSISCPASFCGVVGLTPTYGLVSRYGLIDYANSLDKIGVMGKHVWDVALGLSVIAGKDERDSTSLSVKQDYTKYCKGSKKLKIGVPKEYFRNIDECVEKSVWNAIKLLESEGYVYEEVSLPYTDYALASYYIIAMSEASTNLAKYCGMRYGLTKELKGNFNEYFSNVRSEGFGQEAKRRIILGTYARMSGYRNQFYLKALKLRTLVIQDFKKAFKKVDILCAPTMPIIAPKFKEIENLSPLEHYQSDILTVPVNLAGMPHISIPCGFSEQLPVGLHILGNHLQESKIISLALDYENLRGKIDYPQL